MKGGIRIVSKRDINSHVTHITLKKNRTPKRFHDKIINNK